MGFFRFHLGLYNLSNIKKNNGFNRYLRKIGEEPVIWDPGLTNKSSKQLRLYLSKKGYFNAFVTDTVIKHSKYADLIYKVTVNSPYRINSFNYQFEDTTAKALILSDTIHALIKTGGNLDEEILQNERIRIETLLRNNGYYHFNRNFLTYSGDTDNLKVDLRMIIKKNLSGADSTVQNENLYKQYKIHRVVISTEQDPFQNNSIPVEIAKKDTIFKNGIEYVYKQNFWVRPGVIQQANYMLPYTLYRLSDGEETKRHLLSLNTFSLVNIQFTEIPQRDTSKFGYLDCYIKLTPASIQSYAFTVAGTNSGGNIGGALNLSYQHKSLFGDAENLNLKLTGAVESLKDKDGHFQSKLEMGVEATILLPKFFMPFNNNRFVKKYNPKTSFTMAYNYQRTPDYYTQTSATGSFGYTWKTNSKISHYVRPFELNLVNITNATDKFYNDIRNTVYEKILTNHIIAASGYSFTYNNQKIKKSEDFHYLKWNIETAGNLLRLYSLVATTPVVYKNGEDASARQNGYFTLFGTQYSQYIRTDVDYHFYNFINEGNTVVYRLFGGIGIPYGNSKVMPFEKQYFSGGANSIRGWDPLLLGPGSYKDTLNIPILKGDLKLEANIEYRFKLFWILEGALFTDVGNIWSINPDDPRKEALFKADKFYKDIAIGSGAGLRFLLGYFIGRIDFGMKMRNPALDSHDRWLFIQRKFDFANDKAFSIAIGYPFN